MASSESKEPSGGSQRNLKAAGKPSSSAVSRPDPTVNLESAASCMQLTTMSYINPIMRSATERSMNVGDLYV